MMPPSVVPSLMFKIYCSLYNPLLYFISRSMICIASLLFEGLLTATGDSGLSEMELVDVLSLDDDVLNATFVDWEPNIRRLPPFLWSRMYHDLTPYLIEVERDRCTVLRWSHYHIARIVFRTYLEHQFTYRSVLLQHLSV